ncbi:MAG: HAD family hydrolase [Sandaracinaceae bacterium]|nr:HAD family hydrolase [Sandaracinaceae bacterium]
MALLEGNRRALAYCNPKCREKSLEQLRLAATPQPTGRQEERRFPTLWTIVKKTPPLPPSAPPFFRQHPTAPSRMPSLVWATGLVGVALLGTIFPPSSGTFSIVSILILGACAIALVGGLHLRQSTGWLGYLSAPLAGISSWVLALLTWYRGEDARRALAGSAIAIGLANLRWWLDGLAEAKLLSLAETLEQSLPQLVRKASGPGNGLFVHRFAIRVGDEVVVASGESNGVDGVVTEGQALVLPHPSATSPEPKSAGDPIGAGSRVIEGILKVRATRTGDDSAIDRALRMAMAAGPQSPVERFVTKLSLVFSSALLGGTVLVLFSSEPPQLFERISALLTALPLFSLRSTSLRIARQALLQAAQQGIFFEGLEDLEIAGRLTTIVLPLRGVLTGTPSAVHARFLETGRYAPEELVGMAAAVLRNSKHSLAKAIVELARSIPLPPVRRVAEESGRGMRGIGPHGETLLIGSRRFLLEEGTSLALAEEAVQKELEQGFSAVFFAIDGRAYALFLIREEIHPSARPAVQEWIDAGLTVICLSGNHRLTVEAIARQVDIDQIKAELTFEEQRQEIEYLRELGNRVGLVGHPQLHGGLLGLSDLPIQLRGVGGSNLPRGIALATSDLRDASRAVRIARSALHATQQAILLSALGSALLTLLGGAGLASLASIAALSSAIDVLALWTALRAAGPLHRHRLLSLSLSR